MKVGEDRVIFDEEYSDLIQDAITRSTIRGLVGLGAIRAAPKKGTSRGRFRAKRKKLKRGRTSGAYKGAKSARLSRKDRWVMKVRALRRRLKIAKERGELNQESYWRLYKQVKGGHVKGLKQLRELMKGAHK